MMKKLIQFILAILIAVPLLGQTASPTVTLGEVQNATPGTVNVDLVFKDFDVDVSVGAITLFIEYDPALLKYSPVPIDIDGENVSVSTEAGPDENWLGLSWTNSNGSDFSGPVTLTLQFSYTGGFKADLAFVADHPDFDIADTDGYPINGIDYRDGFVEPAGAPYDATFTLSTLVEQEAGTPVEIDLVGTFTQTAYSANLYIGFDGNLQYAGFSNDTGVFNDPSNPGADRVIKLITNDEIPEGKAITLNFIYLGGGTANIRFLPGSEVGDDGGEPLHVGFVDGEVTHKLTGNEPLISIEKVITVGAVSVTYNGTPGIAPQPESVEVRLSEDINDLGAISLKIAYDTEKLTFKNLVQNGNLTTGWFPAESNGLIEIEREASVDGYTLEEGLLFTLDFEYLVVPDPANPGYLGQAHITFEGGTLLLDKEVETINVGLLDGWIRLILPGDANCDGKVDILDVLAVLGYMADPSSIVPFCFINADVAAPFGTISVLDALGILQIMANQ